MVGAAVGTETALKNFHLGTGGISAGGLGGGGGGEGRDWMRCRWAFWESLRLPLLYMVRQRRRKGSRDETPTVQTCAQPIPVTVGGSSSTAPGEGRNRI